MARGQCGSSTLAAAAWGADWKGEPGGSGTRVGTFSPELRRRSELEQRQWEGRGEDVFEGSPVHRTDRVGFGQARLRTHE